MDTSIISEHNDLVLRAARGEYTERVPVWVHRQAGRYLPEFRKLREEHDFFTICRTPELAVEVTLQPLRRIPYDAAIIFSDILVIPQAFGMEVLMLKGKGPHFPQPLVSPKDFDRLNTTPDIEKELSYVYDAIELMRIKLGGRIPLLGFSGAPWTLMAYMIEGGGSKTLSKSKAWLYKYPEQSHQLLTMLTQAIVEYLVCQVKAGAQMLEVFDTWAEYLSPDLFDTFGIPYLGRIATQVKCNLRDKGIKPVPMTLFAKGAHFAMKKMSLLDYDVLSLDWTMDPSCSRQLIGSNASIQGNLDPCALYGSFESIKDLARKMVDGFGTQRLIANLGHGIYPDHDPEALLTFVKEVQQYSLHKNKSKQ